MYHVLLDFQKHMRLIAVLTDNILYASLGIQQLAAHGECSTLTLSIVISCV